MLAKERIVVDRREIASPQVSRHVQQQWEIVTLRILLLVGALGMMVGVLFILALNLLSGL